MQRSQADFRLGERVHGSEALLGLLQAGRLRGEAWAHRRLSDYQPGGGGLQRLAPRTYPRGYQQRHTLSLQGALVPHARALERPRECPIRDPSSNVHSVTNAASVGCRNRA